MLKERRALGNAELRAIDDDERSFEISFSSEYDKGERWFGIEILSHDPKHVRLGRLEAGAPVLIDHRTDRHVGVTSMPRLDGGKGRVRTRFASDADSEKERVKVQERIKKDVSVGYLVHHITEIGKRSDGSEYRRDVPVDSFASLRRSHETTGRADRAAFLSSLDRLLGALDRAKGDVPKFLVDDWEPYEVSYVAVPFDPTVGLDRVLAAEAAPAQPKENPVSETTTSAPAPQSQPDIRVVENDAIKRERERIQAIRAMGTDHQLVAEADKAVADGVSTDAFRQAVLAKLVERGKMKPTTSAPEIGMTKDEVKQFSVVRLMNAVLNPQDRQAQEAAAFEIECSIAARKANPIDETRAQGRERAGGFGVPFDVLAGPVAHSEEMARALVARIMQRDLAVGAPTTGGNLVATNLLAASFIDLLRNRMQVMAMGGQLLDGLVGNVAIPSQTGGASTYWVTEGNAVTESEATFGQVTLTPKTVGMFTDYSRRTLLQTTPAIEALVRADLANGIAVEIDRAALHGTAASGQPRGIAATAGIGSVAGGTNGAAPTYAHMISLEEQVAIANADVGSLGFMTNAKMRAQLRGTQEFSSTNGQGVWHADNTVLGYRAAVSNNVSSTLTKGTASGVCSAIFFGNWADLLVGMWGGLDLMLDTSALSTSGGKRLVALQDVDVAVRRAASFAAMLDALRT